MNDLDFLQMEEPKVILKYFKTLSENNNEDIIQTDKELSFCRKNNWGRSFENDLQKSRVPFSYVLFPLQEEEIGSDSEWDAARREAGSDINVSEEERNIINLMKQRGGTVNRGSGPANSAANQQLNELPAERCDKVNGHGKEDTRILPDKRASGESARRRCRHASAGGTCAFCVYVGQIKLDDDAESKEGGEVEFGKDLAKSEPGLVQLEDSARGGSAGSEHDGKATPRTETMAEGQEGPAEEQELEPTGEATCFENGGQAEIEEEEDLEEEKRDIFLCSSARHVQPHSLKEASHHVSVTPAALDNDQPHGPTFSRSTFSPNSPLDKQIQLPALFSGLRVLRKGVVGPEHDTVALIGSSSQRTKSETSPDFPPQGGFLEQISTFLNLDKRSDEREVKVVEASQGEKGEGGGEEKEGGGPEPAKPAVSSAEAAFDAFKAFFTPKPLRKDPAEKVDLETLRKKIKADKDALRALFDRTSIKIPAREDSADGKVGHGVDVVGIDHKVHTILLTFFIFNHSTLKVLFQT